MSSATTKSGARRRAPAAVAGVERDGRARIVAAAIRLFADLGYEGTTTAGVAREAGVTQPLVHHHFGSKEGLWRAAMDDLFAGVRDFAPRPGGDPVEMLLALTDQFVRFVALRPEVTRVISREGAVASPRLTLIVDLYLRQPFQQVVELVRAGQEAGVFSPHVRPELFLFFMLGAGSHPFDVAALARESVGIDVTTNEVRDEFVTLAGSILRRGLLPDR